MFYRSLSSSPFSGRQIDLPGNSDLADPQAHTMMGLLVAGQRGAGEISKMMLRAPGVNFALVSSVTCAGQYIHTVSTSGYLAGVSALELGLCRGELHTHLSGTSLHRDALRHLCVAEGKALHWSAYFCYGCLVRVWHLTVSCILMKGIWFP